MACQILHGLPLPHLSALLFLIYGVNAGEIFQQQPNDVSAIIGSQVYFQCRVNQDAIKQLPSTVAKWYLIKGNQAEEITNGLGNRFFIDVSASNGIFDLRIDVTTASDEGTSYLCSFNDTASRKASLNVLPESWKPSCLANPNTEAVTAGDIIEVICTSDGDPRTELLWQKNNVILEDTVRTDNGNTISLSYSETATNNENPSYTCIASLSDMVQSEVCTVGPIQVTARPTKTGAYIPYIIVGLLSVVVSMLFLTLLIVLFRHRRCRMFQREPPQPQTVLDMAALQNGPPLFYPIHDSDDGADDGIGRSPIPDVVPTVAAPIVSNKRNQKSKSVVDRSRRPHQQQQSRVGHGVSRSMTARERAPPRNQNNPIQVTTRTGAPLRRTSSNTTLQGNIDDRDKDKTVTGKKKLTMTNYVKSSRSKRGKATSVKQPSSRTSASSKQRRRGDKSRQSAYQVQSGGGKKLDDDVKSLKQLNVDATTVPASSSRQDRPGPSGATADTSIDTNDISVEISMDDPVNSSLLNDLGDRNFSEHRRSGGHSLHNKNVAPRPVSQDLNNPDQLQHTVAGNSSSTSGASQELNSDKVVYASLNFQKPIGLNILPDV